VLSQTQILSFLHEYKQNYKKQLIRDVRSHHYFDMNAEAIYNVCTDDIAALSETINFIIKEL